MPATIRNSQSIEANPHGLPFYVKGKPFIATEGIAPVTSLHTEPTNQSQDPSELPIEFRVSRNGTPRRRLTLVGKQYTLGNGPDCSVRLDDPTLLPIHATVERRDEGLVLRAVARPITVNGGACTQHKLELGDHFSLGSYEFELVPSTETRQTPQPPSGRSRSEEHQRTTAPRRRVSFAQSIDLLEKKSAPPKPTESLVNLLGDEARESRWASDSQRAILANEKRWQERWQRQQEKHRDSQQRSKEQLESLRAAQSGAELRARQAEEMAQTLKHQFNELSGKWMTVTNSTVPELQEQLEKHQKQSIASQTEHQQLVDSIRKRLDSIQNTIEEVQAETHAMKQHSVFNEEQVRELSEQTDHLEQSLEALTRNQASLESETTEITSGLREELHKASSRLQEVVSELDENRVYRDGIRSAVETLQEALEQVQLDAQQSQEIKKSIENLESQVMSSDARYAELISYFDVQNSHFQEEWESLRQRLEWAEQLAGEASRVATELLHQNDRGFGVGSQATSAGNLQLIHPTNQHGGPELQDDKLTAPNEYTFSAIEHSNRHPAAQPYGEQERSSSFFQDADCHSSTIDSHGCVGVSEDSEFGNPVQMESIEEIGLSIAPSAASDPVAPDSASSENRIHEQPFDDNLHSRHDAVCPIDLDELGGAPKSPNQEMPRLDATMPLSPEIADSISASNLRFSPAPGSKLPVDSVVGQDSSSGTDNRSTIAGGQGVIDGIRQDAATNDDHESLWSSADQQYSTDEAQFVEAVDAEYDVSSQYDDDISNSHQGFSGFGRLEPPPLSGIRNEEGYGEETNAQEIVLSDDTSCEQPLYAPPKTRSAAEILAALGIAVDEEIEESGLGQSSAEGLGDNPFKASASIRAGVGGTGSEIPSSRSHGMASDSHEDAEESIEDYMNRLLNRVQGISATSANNTAEKELSTTRSTVTRSKVAPTVTEEAPKTDEASLGNSNMSSSSRLSSFNGEERNAVSPGSSASSEEYIPRRSAPEKPAKLAALRELANSTARQAIASSARRRLAKEALFKLSIFGVGMIASLTTLAGSRFSLDHWMVISVCCFLLSLFFLWESLNIRKRLLSTNASAEESKASEDESIEATA